MSSYHPLPTLSLCPLSLSEPPMPSLPSASPQSMPSPLFVSPPALQSQKFRQFWELTRGLEPSFFRFAPRARVRSGSSHFNVRSGWSSHCSQVTTTQIISPRFFSKDLIRSLEWNWVWRQLFWERCVCSGLPVSCSSPPK